MASLSGVAVRPLRILIVQETNWIERNVIHQHHLAERLVRRGHHVQVIDYDVLWPEKQSRSWWQPRQVFPAINKVLDGVTVPVTRPATLQLPLLCHMSWSLSSLAEVRRLIAGQELDAVVGLTLTNSYLLARLLGRAGVPFVNVVLEPYHTMMPERWVRPLARRVEQLALRAADAVVVFTPQMQQYVCEMGARQDRVSTLRTGVSLDLFRPDGNGSAYRTELGLPEDKWVLFFMGWLYDFSGLRQIVGRLAGEPSLLGAARLLIVGDGDLYAELRQTVDNAKLGDRVLLTGRQPYDRIPGLVAAADVCLLPSLENDTTRDIVPMKVYEYLAAGKPVVASRLPGLLAEFGQEGGILYGDGPVDVVRRAVALAKEPAEVERLGAAGRRAAEENADWENTTERFEEILWAVAGVHGG